MQQEYPILYDKQAVGTAYLTREGMYFRIRCFICEKVPHPCRITLTCEQGALELGLCVKEGEGYGLTTRRRVADIGQNICMFSVSSHAKQPSAVFYEVSETAAFPHLTQLKNARFARKNGKTGIELPVFTA